MAASNWDTLRKQARHLENDIDLKLVAYSKIGLGNSPSQSTDTAPLLGEHVFDSLSLEIEQMLDKLSDMNEKMSDLQSTGTAMLHTIQRHREICQGYRQEFMKIKSNHITRIQREELLRGEGISQTPLASSSGLNRRDMYFKENSHIRNSHSLVNDQINIAIETRENLFSQRQQFKRMQTRFNDIINRFPVMSSLIQRINIRKRRDSLILGGVIAVCTILLILYTFG